MHRLDDKGAVLVEYAILLPVMLFLALGIFDVGLAMIQTMELTYTTQGAAQVQAQNGTGVAWATSQMPQATFHAFSAQCGAQITATMPSGVIILSNVLPQLSAEACWPLNS